MSEVRIVTDSATLFVNPEVVEDYSITVVPTYVHTNDKVYQLGVDFSNEDFIHQLRTGGQPVLQPPTPDDFLETYSRLNLEVKHIVSIHTTASLSKAYHNAEAARRMILGRCEIAVIDSLNLSAGVGMLAERAGQLAYMGTDFEEIVRDMRKAIGRLYTMFFVESLETLCQNGLLGEPQTILGSMLGIKPFVTVENGQLILIEKAQTTSQAVDKLAEFAGEFGNVEQLAILSHTANLIEPVRLLQDRLALELARIELQYYPYGAAAAAAIGPDGVGLVIFESDDPTALDDWEDDESLP